MKKLTLGLITLCTIAATAYGQGRFTWNNVNNATVADNISVQTTVGGAVVTMPNVAGQYIFGLFVSSSSTDPAQMTPLAYGTNGAVAGKFTAAQINDNTSYNFVVRGWSVAAGRTWAEAQPIIDSKSDPNILYGQSVVGFIVPTVSPTAPSTIWTSIDGFTLSPIPEPSTLGLIGLGLLGLIAIRRRK